MQLILLNTPNQDLPFSCNGTDFVLNIRQFAGQVYASVTINGDQAVTSRRVVLGNDIFEYDYLSDRYGSLVFKSRYGDEITDYAMYNSSVYLEFTPSGS